MQIKLLIDGGSMKPGPAIAQQLGPLGLNMGKVISSVNEATKEFDGMKVPVELNINEKTKEFTIKTSSPPTSELLKKELNLEKGSAKIIESKVGNASIEDVIKIAKIKHANMLEKDLKAAVKSVLGTCASIGILVENESPKELLEKINGGAYESEINKGKTDTSQDKRKKLNQFFTNLKSEQEAIEAKKAAEEAAKEAAKTTETKAAEVKPEAVKKTETTKKTAEKKEEKK